MSRVKLVKEVCIGSDVYIEEALEVIRAYEHVFDALPSSNFVTKMVYDNRLRDINENPYDRV